MTKELATLGHIIAAFGMIACTIAACGGSGSAAGTNDGGTTHDGTDASQSDATPPMDGDTDAGAVVDHGTPSTTYPAFPVDAPMIVSNGGSVLKNPIIVTVTWPSDDPDSATFEAFGDNIGASAYWKALAGEYGVGPATSGASNHVHIAGPAPASMSGADLKDLVTTNVGNGGWPANTPDTMYVIYMSPKTAFVTKTGQDQCLLGRRGFHAETAGGVVYAALARCSTLTASDLIQMASHELNEAATDPHAAPPAFVGFDADHLSYEYLNKLQDEVADACEFYPSSFYTTAEPNFAYPVQRQWSNAASLAGHDACVPATGEGPYFNVTLVKSQLSTIHADLSSQAALVPPPLPPGLTANPASIATKGYLVTLNQPFTFEVDFISDADTGGPWTLSISKEPASPFSDQNNVPIANGTGSVTIDRPSGQNGNKSFVTVNATTMGPTGTFFFVVTSTGTAPSNDAGAAPVHYMPVLVATK